MVFVGSNFSLFPELISKEVSFVGLPVTHVLLYKL